MAQTEPEQRLVQPGEPMPWFRAPALQGNPDFVFDTVAGRPILMLMLGSARNPEVAEAVSFVLANAAHFDDERASFFGVTVDPEDASLGRLSPVIPGIRYFLDFDRTLSQQLGATDIADGVVRYKPHWLVIDRQLRLVGRFGLTEGEKALACLKSLGPGPSDSSWAPVLEIPNVLEPALCQDLITLYNGRGGNDSGFMREVDGKTVLMLDHGHKRRSDVEIDSPELRQILQSRIYHRVKPMISRSFQFEVTRMERYIVACYESENGGHFRPHRDNTTKGTAHRRFAVTINLDADGYEGGDLRFPEFGQRSYRAPTGGAMIFSCSLLHEVLPVTAGRRFAFLPFLYDEASSLLREANNAYLGADIEHYTDR